MGIHLCSAIGSYNCDFKSFGQFPVDDAVAPVGKRGYCCRKGGKYIPSFNYKFSWSTLSAHPWTSQPYSSSYPNSILSKVFCIDDKMMCWDVLPLT